MHLPYCIIALAVARLMRRETAGAGLAMSVRELLTHLAGIQGAVLLSAFTGACPRPPHAHAAPHPTTDLGNSLLSPETLTT